MTITPTTAGTDAPPPGNEAGQGAEEVPVHRLVTRATGTYIARVQPQYLADRPSAVAELARLRRGAGKRAHEVTDLWGIEGMDDLANLLADHGRFSRVEDAEEAVFLACTLWALHQQSGRDQGMHQRNQTLGGAVRALIRAQGTAGEDEEDSPLRKRLVRVGTAESLDSVAVRLREIVLLLRGAKVPLDYARLAGQLYRWQHRPERAGVQREWGREFHLAAAAGKKGRAAASGTDGEAIDRTLAADEEEYGGYAAGE
ncbi:type I-E CRISPR-associated protein Cse2/CasB [Streptomyces griseus]|uniref:Type I-E CRISPR-associated protein Cse2/CasB n=1 Tax=Streptomyces stephensoniae TaxID=3375367 RepID=A0ABU2W8C8_9ACTN|nr:type I-E CRISPR-associated protein Cse2/CasB [Streptomyces griseus]MDT0493347.1 type I-E CRISPR-associated protein Cse2/CasB [Streptomyces griseus]